MLLFKLAYVITQKSSLTILGMIWRTLSKYMDTSQHVNLTFLTICQNYSEQKYCNVLTISGMSTVQELLFAVLGRLLSMLAGIVVVAIFVPIMVATTIQLR